jgi:hypothetical protein
MRARLYRATANQRSEALTAPREFVFDNFPESAHEIFRMGNWKPFQHPKDSINTTYFNAFTFLHIIPGCHRGNILGFPHMVYRITSDALSSGASGGSSNSSSQAPGEITKGSSICCKEHYSFVAWRIYTTVLRDRHSKAICYNRCGTTAGPRNMHASITCCGR